MTTTEHAASGLPSPEQVAIYLSRTGWVVHTTYPKALVWGKESEMGSAEVLAPLTHTIDDYQARITELIRTLALTEGRAKDEVEFELLFPNLDVQHIRTKPLGPSGTTPLHDGYLALKGVRALFLAAATSATLPTPVAVLPSSRPQRARNFLNQVRLGPTGQGSFIFRVETSLIVPADQEDAIPPRQTLLGLYGALEGARLAADTVLESGQIAAFDEQIATGVSANLCEALILLSGQSNQGVDLDFTWSRFHPVSRATPTIAFHPPHVAILRRAMNYLRDQTRARPAEIRGVVVELRSKSPRTSGSVVVEGVLQVEGSEPARRRVTVQLDDQSYMRALDAHRNESPVAVTGIFQDSARTPWIVGRLR